MAARAGAVSFAASQEHLIQPSTLSAQPSKPLLCPAVLRILAPAGTATTITSIAEYTTNQQRRRGLLAASGVNVRTQVTYTSNVTAAQFAQEAANGDTPWLASAYPGGSVVNVTQNGQDVQPFTSPPPPRNRPPPPAPRCGHARMSACLH